MPLTNPGTSFDEDGWADAVEDIRRLWLMAEGGSNDLNKASTDVSQTLDEKGYLEILQNLADLNDVATARDNLGLADLATQPSANVNITGGTIIGVTLSGVSSFGGTFSAPVISGAIVSGTSTIAGANIIGGNISGTTITTAGGTLSGTTILNPLISGGSLKNSTISGCTIKGNNLGGVLSNSGGGIISGVALGTVTLSGTTDISLTSPGFGNTSRINPQLGISFDYVNTVFSDSGTFASVDLDLSGAGSANKTGKLAVWAAGTNTFAFGGAAVTAFTFAAACPVSILSDASIAGAAKSLGFFASTGTTKVSVSDPSAITTTNTAGATYTANEQTMLGQLKTDVTNLRSKLLALIDALQGYNQI